MKWLNLFKTKPVRRELDSAEQDALDKIYGTDGWRALAQDFENRRADLNEDLLAIWYTATANDLQSPAVASISIVSRMRELEEKMQEFKEKYETEETKTVISLPKTIDQFI